MKLNVKLVIKNVLNVHHTQTVHSVPNIEFSNPNQIAHAQMDNSKMPMELVVIVTYNVKLV